MADFLGKILTRNYGITEEELDSALEYQKETSSKLGHILLSQGHINTNLLYRAIAEQQEAPFADLFDNPCDSSLLDPSLRKDYITYSAVPWKRQSDHILVATSDASPQFIHWAEKHYGKNFITAITSPIDILKSINENFANENDKEARELLNQVLPDQSAKTIKANFGFSDLVIFVIISIVLFKWPVQSAILFFSVINVFYASNLLFKLGLVIVGSLKIKEAPPESVNDRQLPIYTILIPLFKEKRNTLRKLAAALLTLEYPRDKLDIKMVVENDDIETIELIKDLKLPYIFEIIKVPYSLPQTKPKALNYALRFARGKYITIYDAEDIPDSLQLNKAAAAFLSGTSMVASLQGKLNYYNRDENILTKMFTIEYASWFDFLLKGLERLDLPIPLGGTSNHIPTVILKEIYGWDAYNVTEDADLGIRLARKGYKVAMLDSLTLEEAPISLSGWIKQRSRWIKGHVQTYLVHMRNPLKLLRDLGFKRFIGFQFFIGAPSLVFLTLLPTIFLSGIFYFCNIVLPVWLWGIALINLVFSILLHSIIGLMVIRRNNWHSLKPVFLLYPFYWLLHSVASFRALWQLFRCPHYWEKTEHGVSAHLKT